MGIPTAASGLIALPAPVVAEIGRVVAEALRRHATPLGDDTLLTPEEVARILRVPTRHVRQLMLDGKLGSLEVPDVGRRCTVGQLRSYVGLICAGEEVAR